MHQKLAVDGVPEIVYNVTNGVELRRYRHWEGCGWQRRSRACKRGLLRITGCF